MNEFENVVTLTDEDGVEVDFEILDVVPYEGGEYAVLLPVDDESDVVDAVILEVLASGEEDEEDMLQGVDDPAVLDAVFGLFIERNKDEFNFEQ
ncbi:MAG: DUF1292 domain-containing protein [Clostridium sp.]|jgi:uncharacterized protein YrzB (UPF0473 family)|nr:DUF1292 domain-containing protein [Clostridium sp.]MCI5914986.1 DUF1292 domain-containing protein [Christensenella sp.]